MTTTKDPIAEAIKKVTTIATLPEVTAKIVATVEDKKSSAAQLHHIVAHDPALVTRILKVVNSAFYGLPGQIGSVERAIVMLGLNAVKNIAVAASLGQLFRGVRLCEGFTARDLWTHCIGVSVAARNIAKLMKSNLAEEAFLSGMIHDVGLLVALQVMPEKLRGVCEQAKKTGVDFCDAERMASGADHQQLGAALAEQWKFPRTCQMVCGYHHRPGSLSDEHRTLVTIVHAADVLCCRFGKGFNLTAKDSAYDAAALAAAGIQQSMLDDTAKHLDELTKVAQDLLA